MTNVEKTNVENRWSDRIALTIVFAVLLLSLGEVVWLADVPLEPSNIAVLLALLVAGLIVVETFVALLVLGLRRLTPRWWWIGLGAASLPLTGWAAHSILSGGWAATLPGVFLIKALLALVLALAVALTPSFFRRLPTAPRVQRRAAVAVALACILCAYADTHLLVGLYPALHYLLAALGVVLAVAAAKLVVLRSKLLERYAVHLLVVLAGVGAAVAGLTWRSVPAMNLAANANGLFPKLRTAIVRSAAPFAADSTVIDDENRRTADPVEAFGFVATTGPEMDRIRARAKHVIFILTDAFRNDFVGRVHEGRELMPLWPTWRDQTFRFRAAYSPSDHTGRSMSALMTSYPWPVVDTVAGSQTHLRTWMNILRDKGYRTFANGHCHYVSLRYSYIPIDYCMGAEIAKPGVERDMVGDIVEFITRAPGEPFAIYTHWMDAHVPASSDVRSAYRTGVQSIDHRLAQLIGELQRLNVYDDTLVVWTADHGFSLGEGHRYHGLQGVVERQVRVPLVLHVPGLDLSSPASETPVSGLQIAPTIIDILAPQTQWWTGAPSLMPLALRREPEPASLDNDWPVGIYSTTGVLHTLRDGPFKLNARTTEQSSLVYDLRTDADERRPLDDDELVARLTRLLDGEQRRHQRLSAALTSHGRREIAPEIAALLTEKAPKASKLQAIIEKLQQYNEPNQVLLLKYVARRQVAVGNELWAQYRSGPAPKNQRLLVVSATSGSSKACKELGREWNRLEGSARSWLAELFEVLPRACAKRLRQLALRDVLHLAEQGFDFSTDEHRSEAALVRGLTTHWRHDAPPELKSLVLRVYLELRRSLKQQAYETILHQRFSEQKLLEAMGRAYGASELPLLEQVTLGKKTLSTLIATVGRIDTVEGKQLLRKLIDAAAEQGLATKASRALRGLPPGDTRKKAIAYLEARVAASPKK